MTMHAEVLAEPERQRAFMNSHMNALRVIRSSIFILSEVVTYDIELRWAEAGAVYQRTLDVRYLSEVFSEIRIQLVNAARTTQIATRRPWYRRRFKPKIKVTRP
jgi:hypothetical protein